MPLPRTRRTLPRIPSPGSPMRPAALAALALLVAGCGADGLTGQTRHAGFYGPALVAAAAAGDGIPLLVRGDPSGGPPPADAAALNERIAAALPPPNWLATARYRPLHASPPAASYRLVLLFDPVATVPGGDEVCGAPLTQPLAPSTGATLRVQATFCLGERAAASVLATGKRPAEVGDPAFHRLMSQIIDALLPVVNPATARSGGGG